MLLNKANLVISKCGSVYTLYKNYSEKIHISSYYVLKKFDFNQGPVTLQICHVKGLQNTLFMNYCKMPCIKFIHFCTDL